MSEDEDVLKRLKDAADKLEVAQKASEQTTEIIKESKRTIERATKDVQLLDTSPKHSTRRKRHTRKKE
jgi:hypothetical protein